MDSTFWITFGIQAVMGVLGAAMHNPKSATFLSVRNALRKLRDMLNAIDLGDGVGLSK